jgi:signal transduction histidine kinase/DNA-binding response OmpR family regulator
MTHIAAIYDFIEPVPVCIHTAAVSDAIELFDQYSVDRLVIVNEQQHPIGLMHAHRLITRVQLGAVRALIDPSLMDELPFFGLHDEIREADFDHPTARFWAVVDDDRHLIGLVDSFYLHKLIEQKRQFEAIRETTSHRFTKQPSETLWHQVKGETTADLAQPRIDIARLKQQLQLQISERGYSNLNALESFDPSNESGTALRSLIQFLEQLPLPLMLQTQNGDVIARNTLWNGQFGDLVDASWIHRDAAALLESGQITARSQSLDLEPSHHSLRSNPLHPLCQLGSTPNTCTCICPLKNGQEKIVQLIRVPLGTLLYDQDAELAHVGQAEGTRSFRLATLAQPTEKSDLARSVPSPEDRLWLVLAQDVTEQQQLARELAAKNADLVQLNRLKDEFLACISHELRTPLTAVLGLSSLLKDQRSGGLNERQVRYAQLIHRSGRHLMSIVNDILDLTRIETGQLELTFYPVTIASACDRAFEQACQLCLEEEKTEAQSPIDASASLPAFILEIEPGLETLVADELRLRQMLVHLLSNALKFTDATGRIGLRVNRWEGWIAFCVWDTGIGIPSEKQHLIFQKFQQLENPLTRRFEGAGLGLVLTQRLARLHGGDISFVSRENQGSQFTLLLPPTHPQPTTSIAVPISHSPANRLVLIVEAVVRSIDHVSERLVELGYRVVIARSGTEAVEKARRLQPFAVLLNPLLPTLSGWDVLTLLKADPQTRQVPVIITGTRGDRDQALRNQADGFLSLPIVQKSLQQVLRQLTVEDTPVMAVEPAAASQVVLRLSPTRYGEMRRAGNGDPINLNVLLHQHNYRVVEADDLEQAELLAQVWKPNVVLLDAAVPDPMTYLRLLSECTFLASLPLVTLDAETTQAANQMPGLSVFPCLAPFVNPALSTGQTETSALLQVIQVAAGFAWRPLVFAIDSAQFVRETEPESAWLQALTQYLQTAGFRGGFARSWQDLIQKLDVQSVNLVLLHWHHDQLDPIAEERLAELAQLKDKPPILVIHHGETREMPDAVSAIATQILPPLSMESLLEQVNSLLTE